MQTKGFGKSEVPCVLFVYRQSNWRSWFGCSKLCRRSQDYSLLGRFFRLFLIVFGASNMHAMLSSLRYTLFSWVVLQVHGSWVDPDTPENSLMTNAMSPGDERSFELVRWNRPEWFPLLLSKNQLTLHLKVFSDEFEQDGRKFNDGSDPRWTALNKNDCTIKSWMRRLIYFSFFPDTQAYFFTLIQIRTWRYITIVMTMR